MKFFKRQETNLNEKPLDKRLEKGTKPKRDAVIDMAQNFGRKLHENPDLLQTDDVENDQLVNDNEAKSDKLHHASTGRGVGKTVAPKNTKFIPIEEVPNQLEENEYVENTNYFEETLDYIKSRLETLEEKYGSLVEEIKTFNDKDLKNLWQYLFLQGKTVERFGRLSGAKKESGENTAYKKFKNDWHESKEKLADFLSSEHYQKIADFTKKHNFGNLTNTEREILMSSVADLLDLNKSQIDFYSTQDADIEQEIRGLEEEMIETPEEYYNFDSAIEQTESRMFILTNPYVKRMAKTIIEDAKKAHKNFIERKPAYHKTTLDSSGKATVAHVMTPFVKIHNFETYLKYFSNNIVMTKEIKDEIKTVFLQVYDELAPYFNKDVPTLREIDLIIEENFELDEKELFGNDVNLKYLSVFTLESLYQYLGYLDDRENILDDLSTVKNEYGVDGEEYKEVNNESKEINSLLDSYTVKTKKYDKKYGNEINTPDFIKKYGLDKMDIRKRYLAKKMISSVLKTKKIRNLQTQSVAA